MNRKFICEYDREKVNKKLMNSLKSEGIRKGEIKGRLERNIEVARNMLNDKVNLKSISKYTGLSINQINSLK